MTYGKWDKELAAKTVCGIDFGTSNSTVAIATANGDVRLVSLEGPASTIPSAVFFPSEGLHPLFGRSAINAYRGHEEGRFMRSFKRALGTSLMSEGTIVNGRKVPFEEIIASFILHIKHKAEKDSDSELTQVVAGRPVNFVDNDEVRNKKAESQLEGIYKKSGFKDVRFQFEPIAAAFAHEKNLDNREYLAIVLDIGGGTSDFSVIRLSHRYIDKPNRADDILANTGIRVGGNDFDRKLSLREFMPLLGMGSLQKTRGLPFPTYPFFDLSEWSKIQFMYAPKYLRELTNMSGDALEKEKVQRLVNVVNRGQGHNLLSQVEDAKIELSEKDSADVDLSFVEDGLALSINRTSFETAIEDERRKIESYTRECLKQAGVKGEDVNLVILTGGGTGIPVIQQIAKTEFPHAHISNDNMLSSVGLGLAYDASRIFLGQTREVKTAHIPLTP